MIVRNEDQIRQMANLYRRATFGLISLALLSITLGVAAFLHEVTWDYLFIITWVALLLGWNLAGCKLSGWLAGLILFASGILLIFVWVGQFSGLLWAWMTTLPAHLWQLAFRNPAEFNASQIAWGALWLRWQAFSVEMGQWVRFLFAGNPFFNYGAAALFWGLIIWFVASWGIWWQRRHAKALIAILPGGVLLLGLMGYTYGSTRALVVLIFATLLLSAINNYMQKEHNWQSRGMDFPGDLHVEIFPRLLELSFVFMLAAALVPRIYIPAVVEKMQAWTNPRQSQVNPLSESFGLQQPNQAFDSLENAIAGGLPREHLIGSGPELSEQVVMRVQISNGLSPAESQQPSIPLYWRSYAYDQYTGHGWQTSPIEIQDYTANDAVQSPAPENHLVLQQKFNLINSTDALFVAGDLITVDQAYRLAGRSVPDATLLDLFAGTVDQPDYQVASQIPVPSAIQLRAVTDPAPAWISVRYLALPNSLPQRVVDLARDLTRDAPTSYDRARAIETYLRGYEYRLDLPAPPRTRDLVDTFLFELQKGYCDYYASAMVVLSRAVGLPARLAVGYTRGTYDTAEQAFIVTEENAHTWAEIYFTGFGWVPFEPTAAQPEIIRTQLDGETRPEPETIPQIDLEEQPTTRNSISWLTGVAGILSAVVILLGIWILGESLYLRLLSPSALATQLFYRLYRYGARLGIPAQAGDTPYEFAAILERRTLSIAATFPHERYLASLLDALRGLTQLYMQASFSSHPLGKTERAQLLQLWPGLQFRLWLARGWLGWRSLMKTTGSPAGTASRT